MKRSIWFLHPISIFIFSIVALGLSLFLYIYWYVEVSAGLKAVLEKSNLEPQQFVAWQTWVVIMVLSILVGIILMGIFIIFAYQRKTLALYSSQHKFINSFTHELKTPTTSLRLYLETFVKHDLPRNKQMKYLEYMLEDVDRLSANITGILDLARIEAKIYRGEFVVVNLVDEVEKFCRKNEQLFRGSKIYINSQEKQGCYCSINLSLFHMILMNLISNAIKYNDTDCPLINITFSQTEQKVTLCIEDNGVGFEKSHVKKIFNKFVQIERADWSQTGGTGLGLYMVAQVTKFHKGRVSAHSDGIGKGARFTISLPLQKVSQTENS
jgi:two-component system phosphate regulon sensor histidine kinase PhoR